MNIRNFIIGFFLTVSTSCYCIQPVIFDTDMAIDDWAALLLLAMHPEIDLIGVTANGVGETHCQPAMENIPKLLNLTGAGEVDFACGDKFPLDGFFAFPQPWRDQADTLSGISLPPSPRTAKDMHAVDLIHQLINGEDSKPVLVATGSLTNIAQWLERFPQDKEKVARAVIMGGAFDVSGNIIVPGFTDNHPNQQAEWNIFVDPKAAALVFSSGLPIEVVGLDVTNRVKVTAEFAQKFKQQANNPAAVFWDKVLDDNEWFIDSGEYYFWDVLAALVAIDPTFCLGSTEPVMVSYEVTEQPWQPSSLNAIPSTTATGTKRNHLDAKTSGITRAGGNGPPVKICRETNSKQAFEIFIDTLTQAL